MMIVSVESCYFLFQESTFPRVNFQSQPDFTVFQICVKLIQMSFGHFGGIFKKRPSIRLHLLNWRWKEKEISLHPSKLIFSKLTECPLDPMLELDNSFSLLSKIDAYDQSKIHRGVPFASCFCAQT